MSATIPVVRERPILFSAPMIRALLDGRKTQTRRVIAPQPEPWATGWSWHTRQQRLDRGGFGIAAGFGDFGSWIALHCPHGAVGDRLWVRETFTLQTCVDGEEPPFADSRPIRRRPESDWEGLLPLWTQPHYRATDPAPDLCCESESCAHCRDHDAGPHWRPSIFMPRWASRILLEIETVRAERVQAIPFYDIRAEGVSCPEHDFPDGFCTSECPTLRSAFVSLWKSLNEKRGYGWDVNPWVWAITFRRVTP